MARKFAAVVFSLGCLQASSVMALGLGELELESFLNEPLKASVDLLNTSGLHQDEIKIRLATREDFEKLGLDRAYFLTNIKFEVEIDDAGKARIVMTSDDPVLEPYLDFVVEARWPSGRLMREYTVLIDPPTFSETAFPSVSASQRVEEVEGIPAPAKKKQSETITSGTSVDIKKSGLAPGAMPQRDFNASTSPTPVAGSRYMISRDETLWEIANEAKPEGISVHQTMLDIQRLNPQAFINGNINRVKAGYIVYLPSAQDISSSDLAAALADVREQNQAWREGRDAELAASRGPSLRISADPEEDTESDAGAAEEVVHQPGDSAMPSAEPLDMEALEGAGADERMAAMMQQIETLQKIVSIKDEQIAALQVAQSESVPEGELGQDVTAEPEDESMELMGDADDSMEAASDAERVDVVIEEEVIEEEVAPSESEASQETPTPVAKPKPAQPVVEAESGGLMDNLLYIVGAAVLAIIGFILVRRRSKGDGDASAPSVNEDVFSGVQLQDEELEVEPHAETATEEVEQVAAPERHARGYGERKHDEYASDVETADALAEADIYIAYGRHPQAIDLLNNALASEPGNPVYLLKLIEIHTEQKDRGAAAAQFEQLQATGDVDSITRAESLMSAFDASPDSFEDVPAQAEQEVAATVEEGPGLTPNPLQMDSDGAAEPETDFSGLEIEGADASTDDELDLSADFDSGQSTAEDDEELVIAADANGMSTKMDLARAYLDMDDHEGARQILEEVVAEGSDELKAEARSLLERIG